MSTSSHFLRRRRRGAAMIEFGLWLPTIMFIMSALLDFSWYIASSQNVMQAARDGARTAASAPDDPGSTTVNETQTAAIDAAKVVIDAMKLDCPTDAVVADVVVSDSGIDYVTVTVTCPFNPLLDMAPGLPDDVAYSFTMLLDRQIDSVN